MNTSSHKQLFTDAQKLLWSRPERSSQKAKLLIIGGYGSSFSSVTTAFEHAQQFGVGEISVLLPDSLKNKVPPLAEISFATSTANGSFAKDSFETMASLAQAADCILLPGDLSNNSETELTIEKFVADCIKPIVACNETTVLSARTGAKQILIMNQKQLQEITKKLQLPYTITSNMSLSEKQTCVQQLATDIGAIIVFSDNNFTFLADKQAILKLNLNQSPKLCARIAVLTGEFPDQPYSAALAAIDEFDID